MPKIRDLGINTIPVTMRPPEIGPGGGLFAGHKTNDQASACESPSCVGNDHSHCGPHTCKPDDETSACGSPSCIDDEASGCESPSCLVDDASGCESPSCIGHDKDSPRNLRVSGFSAEAIAQLRQQLEIQIGT